MNLGYDNNLLKTDSNTKRLFHYRNYILVAFLISYALIFFHRMTSGIVAEELSSTFQIGATSLGILSSAYFYPYALIQIPVGLMVDRFGPRRIVSASLAIAGIAAVIFGMTQSFSTAVIARVLIGFGAGCVYIPALKMLSCWYRKKEFASLTGVMMAAGNFGALAAALPLAWLVKNFGWRESFYIMGMFTVFIAIIDYLIIRNHPSEIGCQLPDGGTDIEPETNHYSVKQALSLTLRKKEFWPLAIWSFFICGTLFGFQGLWGIPYLMQAKGLTKIQAGSLLSMIPLGIVICAPIAGYLSDKVFHSRKMPAIFGSIIYTIVWFFLAFFSRWLGIKAMYALLLIYGFGFGFFGISFAQIKDLYPLSLSGTVTSTYNVFGFIGAAFFQTTMGKIISLYPGTNQYAYMSAYSAAFQFCFIAMVIGNVFLLSSKESKL
jgi:sugar phosphate permease